jgi:hypothetical protein
MMTLDFPLKLNFMPNLRTFFHIIGLKHYTKNWEFNFPHTNAEILNCKIRTLQGIPIRQLLFIHEISP